MKRYVSLAGALLLGQAVSAKEANSVVKKNLKTGSNPYSYAPQVASADTYPSVEAPPAHGRFA